MNIDSYIKRTDFQKLLLAEGNRPLVFLDGDKVDYLSELVLDRDEVTLALKALGLEAHLDVLSMESFFYKNGNKYLAKTLCFSDSVRVEIIKTENKPIVDIKKFNLPGYVSDWAQSKKGLIFFYGADCDLIDEIKFSFAQERAQNVLGSTLIVSKKEPKISGIKGHSISLTAQENFLEEDSIRSLDFNTYLLAKDFHLYKPLDLLRLVEKNALILVQSPWSSLEKFLYSFKMWSSQNSELSQILLQESLGFLGVKGIKDVNNNKRPIFEVTPIEAETLVHERLDHKSLKGQGISFNQYLHELLLKREISLKEAYSSSLDPEGLNNLLDEGNKVYGH